MAGCGLRSHASTRESTLGATDWVSKIAGPELDRPGYSNEAPGEVSGMRPVEVNQTPAVSPPTPHTTARDPFDLSSLTLTRQPGADALPEDEAAERAASIPPGVVINGRYRIDRLLGRGGMGAVYRVDDQLFPGRPTALKLFLQHVTVSVDLFRAEFRTMASLRHPNVARVYDFENKIAFLVENLGVKLMFKNVFTVCFVCSLQRSTKYFGKPITVFGVIRKFL